MSECIRMASGAAAIAASKAGAAPSIPKLSEVRSAIVSMTAYPDEFVSGQRNLVNEYLSKHIKNAKLDELAAILNYSTAYASRWIKEETGYTFSELLQMERCKTAAEYLKDTDMPVHEIIGTVGYCNESFFRKKFYEVYKMLPLEYRKNYKL